MKLIPIVLSGGSGTRLWPISTAANPKQFSSLLSDTLQTLTLKRLACYEPSIIVTGEKLKTLTEKEISEHQFKVSGIIYESAGKNTAPAVAIACRYLELSKLEKNICGVFSSDALITKENEFHAVIEKAYQEASQNKVVVLGIKPSRIETGFGYIQIPGAAALNKPASVLKFHEKPNYQTAEKFISDGNFFWNAGIFIFSVQSMIAHFKQHQPEMWSVISELKKDLSNIKDIYAKIKSISFDYAIIEKLNSDQLSCIPCDIGWSDLGSWDVLDEINSSQKLEISQSAIEVNSKNNTVFSHQKKIYSFVGADDLIVIDTPNALLICKKGTSQQVKDVVEALKNDPKTSGGL